MSHAAPTRRSPAGLAVPSGLGPVPASTAAKGGGLLLLVAAAVAFPQVYTNPAVTLYGVFALIYVTAATGWNIFSGNTGYISLGQAVFYGSGAYALAIGAHDWHIQGLASFALLPLCAAVGAVIAVPFGLIALRVRRHTFIVITIAIFFIFQLMAFNFWFTGGSSGLGSPFLSWAPTPYNQNFYYIALACTVGRCSSPGWSGGRGSGCSCGRSGTTRTG